VRITSRSMITGTSEVSGLKVFIDTQLWVYSFKKPQRDAFESESQYREAVDMHNKSRALIR